MKYILALVCLLAIGPAFAGDVKLDWTPPTTCADGSALSNCPTTGFETLHGTDTTGTYSSIETVAANVTSRTYQNLSPGKHCFSVKTISNIEKSAESVRSCATVASVPPKAPSGITVTVQVTVATQ